MMGWWIVVTLTNGRKLLASDILLHEDQANYTAYFDGTECMVIPAAEIAEPMELFLNPKEYQRFHPEGPSDYGLIDSPAWQAHPIPMLDE